MNSCPRFSQLLVLPHLRIQNANAISSPLTHGFPSMTAFLGLMWALERKSREAGLQIAFNAVGVVCHAQQEQVTEDRYVKSFRLTRNPVGKDGTANAIVEEGRIHLDISLIFAVHAAHWTEENAKQADVTRIADMVSRMRVAGGVVLAPERPGLHSFKPWVIDQSGAEDVRLQQFKQGRMRLLPGSALVNREDLLDKRLAELRLENPDVSPLDAWLSLSRVNWRHRKDPDEENATWKHDRAKLGWIVPIPVGYGGISGLHEAGTVAHTRDNTTPFRFVEGLYSIGEWIGPHRIQTPEQMLWYADSDEHVYRCRNDYVSDAESSDWL